MADVLVEETWRIDDTDMAAIIGALAEIGVEAEPTEQATLLKMDGWVLVLAWAAGHADHAIDPMLEHLARRVAAHFRTKKPPGVPPRFVDLLGPDGEILKRVEVPDDDS